MLHFRPDDVERGARRVEDILQSLPEPTPDVATDVEAPTDVDAPDAP